MENEIYKSLLIVGVTMIFVTLFIPLVKRIAKHIGAIDIPNERKVHKNPIPRLGGLGIYAGFLLGYILFGHPSLQMNSILIGSFIIIITGLCDDIKPIKPLPKLIGQIAAACILVFYGNIVLNNITVFGQDIEFGIFAYPITIMFVVACTNVINLIDGLDGLSGGISSIFYLSTIIICFFQERFTGLEFTLALIMLGSTLGFLFHNFNPARIFAGDSGAMFMGYVISVISLLGFKTTVMTSIFAPLAILAVPILDTLFAIIRRLINHKHIYDADKEHLHHQLLKMNFSHKMTVIIIYIITALFSAASILYTLKDNTDVFIGRIIYIVLAIVVFIFVWKTDIIVKHDILKKKKK
jgi:UDP-GlcNAc:undecaprenyl-phosphate GlcNAc-1-phosphate transferase